MVCVALAAAAGVLGATACSPGGAGAAVGSLRAPPPDAGGILRMFGQPPMSLDPPDVNSVYESLPIGQIFDGLVALDADLSVSPRLAEVWTISRDGLVYTFTLRPEVRFHDGTPLVAADVVHTFRRVLDPGRATRSVVEPFLSAVSGAVDYAAGRRSDLPGVVALDEKTVEIRLDHPQPAFLEVLSLDQLRIVSREAVAAKGEAFARSPIGTGPFELARWDEEGITLVSNPFYFRGAPLLDAVRILFPREDEEDGGFSRFSRGEIDVIEPREEALAALAGNADVRLSRQPELSLWFLGMNTGVPGLDDTRVRRAIAHAVDRGAIAALSAETRRPALGILPPGIPGYTPSPKVLPRDLEAARGLLAEAGHPEGVGLGPFRLAVARGSSFTPATVDLLVDQLAEVGIAVEVEALDWAELSRRVDDHDAQMFLLGWVADLGDPDGFLRALFVPAGSANFFLLNDLEAAALLDRGARETNPVGRARIYTETERRILGEAPLVPLFHSLGVVARRAAIRGIEPGPMGLYSVDLEKAWIARRGA